MQLKVKKILITVQYSDNSHTEKVRYSNPKKLSGCQMAWWLYFIIKPETKDIFGFLNKGTFHHLNTKIVKLRCKVVQVLDRCCILNCSSFSLGKHGGYSKYEVTPPPQQQQQQQQDYDERKQHDQRGGDQGGYGPRKQVCNKSLAIF